MKPEEMEQALGQIYDEIIGDGPTAKYFCERNRVDCPRSSEEEDYSPDSDECVGCPHFKVYWRKEEEAPPCLCSEEKCACPELTGEDADAYLKHLAPLAQESQWRLTYKSLEDKVWRLCCIGTCGVCGKQMCVGFTKCADTVDGRFTAVYRHLATPCATDAGSHEGVLKVFEVLFREEDRATVHDWLSRPENLPEPDSQNR